MLPWCSSVGTTKLLWPRGTPGSEHRLLPFINELRHICGADFYGYLDLKSRHKRATSEKRHSSVSSTSLLNHSRTRTPLSALPTRSTFTCSKRSYFLPPTIATKKPAKVEVGLPVFECEEDSETLRQLLLFVYLHGRAYQIDRIDTFHKLRRAAQKYKMAAAEERLKLLLLASSVPVDEPLRVFAIAVTLGWGDVAKSAAIITLKEPLNEMAYVDELKQITGADLYWLIPIPMF